MADDVQRNTATLSREPRNTVARWLRDTPAPTRRLPSHKTDRATVVALLALVEERPGRPVPLPVAMAVYDQVAWLTRIDGVLFARFGVVADLAQVALDRLTADSGRRYRVTHAKVAAVIRHLVAAGWMAAVRKTCRQAVFTVAQPPDPAPAADASAEALEPPVNPTTSTPSGVHARVDLVHNSDLGGARAVAQGIIDRHRGVLACKGCTQAQAAGAWFRYLHARLRWCTPARLEHDARLFDQAVALMAAPKNGSVPGRAWLSDARFVRAMHQASRG